MRTVNGWTATAAIALAQAAFLVWHPASAAASGRSSFGADDPQGISCELVTKMHEKAPTGTERQFYNWAQGYFAGRSAAVPGAPARTLPVSGAARTDVFQKLLGYCARNPSATFGAAVLALWETAD